MATFDVKYYSPDGKVGKWEEVEFDYPLIQQYQKGEEVDGGGPILYDLKTLYVQNKNSLFD